MVSQTAHRRDSVRPTLPLKVSSQGRSSGLSMRPSCLVLMPLTPAPTRSISTVGAHRRAATVAAEEAPSGNGAGADRCEAHHVAARDR